MEQESERKSSKKGYRIIFLLSLAFAVLFECLIFMHSQVKKIESLLKSDFRIILVKSSAEKKEAVLEKVSALKGVKSAVFVSSQETMEKIKQDDRELYYSLSAVGRNPVPDIIEVELEDAALGDLENFTGEALKINGVEDVKYKILESYAIIHFSFYSNFLSVIISLTLLVSILILFTGMAHAGFSNFFTSLKSSMKWFSAGLLGAACAIFFVYLVIYPVKYLSPVWAWPAYWWHAVVAAICGLFGWVFYQWKKS